MESATWHRGPVCVCTAGLGTPVCYHALVVVLARSAVMLECVRAWRRVNVMLGTSAEIAV